MTKDGLRIASDNPQMLPTMTKRAAYGQAAQSISLFPFVCVLVVGSDVEVASVSKGHYPGDHSEISMFFPLYIYMYI